MSFTQPTMATNNISALDTYPNDNQGLTDVQAKLKFDQFGIDAKAFLINLINEIQSSTLGSSGAENIGYPDSTNNTVYKIIQSILSAGSGTIPPDRTITNLKIALATITNAEIALNTIDETNLNQTLQNKIDRAYSSSKLYAYKNIGGAL